MVRMKKIDAGDWPLISALFDQALDLPSSQHRQWLESLPEHQLRHRDTLERLLANHARLQTQDFLQPPPRVRAAADPERTERQRGADVVGPYRLLRELGRGGMGSVWLAERADGLLKRQVALKLPHPGLATQAFAERLERERDILASLAHPHIARLYDAGVSAEGQPYIALAYVNGRTLVEHCREHEMNVRERVVLFLQVLAAVQYAHSNLVIHRDLKPSNVLVDEQGQVHLLDFGIAKLLVEGQAEATELTLHGGQALTPDYASPEQIAGASLSTASDVYSLGVLLYQLLTGERPYQLPRLAGTALARAVLEIDVPRPSSVVSNHASARQLRGDLDTIILKALKKNPAERYASADAFDQDLRRHLAGEPVLARADGWGYRAGKFLRRHRLGVGLTALVIVSLGVSVAAASWQARQAHLEARRAEAVKEFLVGLFNETDPAKAQGRDVSARELLDRGQTELKTKLADQPRLRAELIGVLAQLYAKLDAASTALPLAQSWRDLSLELDGSGSVAYGDALYHVALMESELRRPEAAYASLQKAYEVLRHHAGDRQGVLLKIQSSMAYELSEQGRFKEAAQSLEPVLPEMEAFFGKTSWEVIEAKAALSRANMGSGDPQRAAAIDRQIEPLLDSADPAHATDVPGVLTNMAINRMALWLPDEAVPLLHKALADWERLVGPETPGTVSIERTLAYALYANGQFDEAARLFDDNVARAVRVVGEDSPATKQCESYSVRSLILVGRVADADAMARRSLAGAPGATSTQTTSQRDFNNRLALAMIFDGQADQAAKLLVAGAALARQNGTEQGDDYGRLLHYLAGARLAQGRFEDAAAAAQQAEQVFEHSALGRDMYVALAQLTRALALARVGRAADAALLVARAKENLTRVSRPDHPVHLFAQLVRAEAVRAAGKQAEGDRLDADARARLKSTSGAVLPPVLPLVF
jgi:eukaryotic-like serine/threonine-protein kinase